MNVVNVGYDSTNYYVIADSGPKLLVDVGWPGTLPKLQHACKRTSIQLADLKYFLITHYHPDHAGLAQELKRTGIKLIVMETQVSAIPTLRNYMKSDNHYVEIDLTDNVVLHLADSRSFLAKIGIRGEIISTPGHSEDSVTLILDDGAAFTGDLPHPSTLVEGDTNTAQTSWESIQSFNVKTVYPGHGPAWRIE